MRKETIMATENNETKQRKTGKNGLSSCMTKKREALIKQWSEPLRTKTYIEIANMLTCEYPAGELRWVIGDALVPYACFKNINGKYGRMTVENASDNHHAPSDQCCYEITRSDGAKETFPSVDSLIDAGWVLD
jgi:hypothetical protein